MAYWHEQARHIGRWVFPNRQGRVTVVFQGHDIREAPFQGYFLRYEGEGEVKPMGWKRDPVGWVEVWPREPLLAWSMDEAKAQFQPLLPQIEDGNLGEQYERRAYLLPVRPKLVAEVEHPTHQARARILRWPDGRYQVRYLVYAPDGRYFPASTPSVGVLGWEWGVAREDIETFADDLASAERIASEELAEVVTSDPEIKPRDAGPSAA